MKSCDTSRIFEWPCHFRILYWRVSESYALQMMSRFCFFHDFLKFIHPECGHVYPNSTTQPTQPTVGLLLPPCGSHSWRRVFVARTGVDGGRLHQCHHVNGSWSAWQNFRSKQWRWTRWWLQIFFSFHPDPSGNIVQLWQAHFSNGLVQPPTSARWFWLPTSAKMDERGFSVTNQWPNDESNDESWGDFVGLHVQEIHQSPAIFAVTCWINLWQDWLGEIFISWNGIRDAL